MDRSLAKAVVVYFLPVLVIGCLFPSCREECHYKPRSLAGLEFRTVMDGNDRVTPVGKLSVWGVGREDSLLYSSAATVSIIGLPLNGNTGESAFVLDFGEESDTLRIFYEVIPWFLSPECGFMLNFNLLHTEHSSNYIDSVVTVTTEVTSFNETNIRIYH